MNKKLKVFLIVIAILLVGGYFAFDYVLHGGARDVQSEDTAYSVKTNDIVAEFTTNLDVANKKYLEKPVAISGIVTSINKNEVILDNAVNCNLSKEDASIIKNQSIVVKGRVVGYDDLLGELKLDQCTKSN